MRIIDAHLHFCPSEEHFCRIARLAGHENTEKHLKEQYRLHNIAGGIVMGNRSMDPDAHRYPGFLRYCIGLDSSYLRQHRPEDAWEQMEENLKRPDCVGIKLYPGYSSIYISDPVYDPVYKLAEKYRKPVAVHMGQTAGPRGYLKYSHPLTMDEAAVRHPGVQFVMCHFGNPWLMDAAAVVEKNDNVAADLSGLLEGKLCMPEYFRKQKGYLDALKTWIAYCDDYGKFMFGTDWPLANYEDYIALTRWLIPKEEWERVFSKNAIRIYGIDETALTR